MKKLFATILAITMAAALLAGCGSQSTGSDSESTTAASGERCSSPMDGA